MSVSRSDKNKMRIRLISGCGMLSAMTVLLAFIPIKVGPIETTLAVIPIAIGGIVFGQFGGALLGLVFGITSFLQCLGYSPFGVLIFDINPFYTIVLCVIPRVFMGWLAALAYEKTNAFFSKKNTKTWIPEIISCFLTPFLNTLFFTGLFSFLFNDLLLELAGGSNTAVYIITGFVGFNAVFELLICMIICPPTVKAIKKYMKF